MFSDSTSNTYKNPFLEKFLNKSDEDIKLDMELIEDLFIDLGYYKKDIK